MSLLRCGDCTTEYAAGLTACPHCGSGASTAISGPSYLEQSPPPSEPTPSQRAAGGKAKTRAADGGTSDAGN